MSSELWLDNIRTKIENSPARSAWAKGVRAYALELWENIPDDCAFDLETELLQGASDWREYSRGGCALIYNGDIAQRLCSPSELRKTDNGRLMPNSREDWLDVQARALYQAAELVRSCF